MVSGAEPLGVTNQARRVNAFPGSVFATKSGTSSHAPGWEWVTRRHKSAAMTRPNPAPDEHMVAIASRGETLATLRVLSDEAVRPMRQSLSNHRLVRPLVGACSDAQ